MEIDISNYDVDAIRSYFNDMKREQEDYYGTAMMNNMEFAMVDLINVSSEFDVTGRSDEQVVLMAYNMGILDDFRIGKRY